MRGGPGPATCKFFIGFPWLHSIVTDLSNYHFDIQDFLLKMDLIRSNGLIFHESKTDLNFHWFIREKIFEINNIRWRKQLLSSNPLFFSWWKVRKYSHYYQISIKKRKKIYLKKVLIVITQTPKLSSKIWKFNNAIIYQIYSSTCYKSSTKLQIFFFACSFSPREPRARTTLQAPKRRVAAGQGMHHRSIFKSLILSWAGGPPTWFPPTAQIAKTHPFWWAPHKMCGACQRLVPGVVFLLHRGGWRQTLGPTYTLTSFVSEGKF